jgi:hypothetical protein
MIYKINNILIIKNVKGQMRDMKYCKVGKNHLVIAGIKYPSTIEKGNKPAAYGLLVLDKKSLGTEIILFPFRFSG